MTPKKREDLFLTDLGDELVIYDPTNFQGHNLNKTALLTFQHCNGDNTEHDLAEMLEQELKVDDGTSLVILALKQLTQKGLLEKASVPEPPSITRRQVLAMARAAGLAIALVPVIQTIVVPEPAAAASLLGCSGEVQGNCPAGYCCVSGPKTFEVLRIQFGAGVKNYSYSSSNFSYSCGTDNTSMIDFSVDGSSNAEAIPAGASWCIQP
ncbi:MAG: PqqD family protein [Chloroflexota bacterium]